MVRLELMSLWRCLLQLLQHRDAFDLRLAPSLILDRISKGSG